MLARTQGLVPQLGQKREWPQWQMKEALLAEVMVLLQVQAQAQAQVQM